MGDDLIMTQYIKKSDYEAVQLDDQWIILNTDQFTVTKLNDLGGYCWSLLDSPQTVERMTQLIEEKYLLDNNSLSSSIQEFLQELIEYGLVQHAV